MRADDRRTFWLFTGTALALGILIVLTGFQPSAVNWGVHFPGFLSPGGTAIVCLLHGMVSGLVSLTATWKLSRCRSFDGEV